MTIALSMVSRVDSVDTVIHTLLQDPEGVVDDLVEKYHSQSLARFLCRNAAENANRGNGLLIHNYEPLPTPRINQLVIPTGATRWSYCLLLADDTIKNQIYAANENGKYKMMLTMGSPMTGRNEEDHAVRLGVYTLPARRVSPDSLDETVNNLWIIPVVDERYRWQWQHVGELSATVGETTCDTPEELLETVFLLLEPDPEFLITEISASHTLLPSCASNNDYENLPIVLDSIAAHYGMRIVPDIGSWDSVTNEYGQVQFTGSNTAGTTRWVAINGKQSVTLFDACLRGNLGLQAGATAPAGTYVVGKPFIVAGGVSSALGTAPYDVAPTVGPYATVPDSVDIGTTGGQFTNKTLASLPIDLTGLVKSFECKAIWRTDYVEEPSSTAITQIARDYYHQWALQFDYTFAGVQPWQQGFCDDYMVIRQTWNQKTKQYDAYTRVCSRQPNLVGEYAGNQGLIQAVILDEALGVATQSKTGATSALARICSWKPTTDDYIESQSQITVWNHSETTGYAVDTFGIALNVNGHRIFIGDCAAMANPNRTALV